MIKQFSDKILLSSKRDVLKLHLYLKFLQNKIRPFENDIDIILELYLFGGYSNVDEQTKFIDLCISKGLKKSAQSVRNTFSKYISLKVFEKRKNTNLNVSNDYIPDIEFDKLILQYIISHAD